MATLRDEVRFYLESILGVPAHVERSKAKVAYGIQDAYALCELTLQFEDPTPPLLLLASVADEYPGAITLGKHIAQVRKATEAVPVYVCKSLSAQERRSLIAHRLNFIQPGYQMFIPELAMDLRERFRKRETRSEVATLLPAAQAMLLRCLYEGWSDHPLFQANALMGKLRYSRVTLSKVVDQLLQLKLIQQAQRKAATHSYAFAGTPSEVFKQALPCLRSPVKRKVAIDAKPPLGNGTFLAGETALATYTMLAEPQQPVYGMTKQRFDQLSQAQVFRAVDSVDETHAWVEIWAYATLEISGEVADEASLLLSLDTSPDERIQIALDELRERLEWLKSEG
ncbi:hypothetical protein CCOS865_00925 [Pseudomonas reidholzensis]|uniref:MarR family transcriptional regulator n=1 Tax=Pseudomonas reidholzensis TaxID=1785162 RepID=A0A383RQ99_9PSED|nr:hypothetical protein [Pseudomonas reidholzensis]SYX88686.1 hypothetical protein CCOS865_00925 [Pseudomonas reidholzensis]